MFGAREFCPPAVLVLVCAVSAATAAGPEPVGRAARIAVGDVVPAAAPVAPWDAASPQRLVRIDGALYQQDAGFYYRVVEDRIAVRPIDGMPSWDALVARAVGRAPAEFETLAELSPIRTNRLGIVDLAIPRGDDPAKWCELVFRTGLVRYAEVATHGAYTIVPDDPQYLQQWALNNDGQTGGTAGADIDAELAWTLTAGTPATVVAVLDSGTSIDHEDLALNVWHNEGEIPDNGIDDDGNGFVDDWEGWDFGNGNNDPRSSSFHGTHVTGIISAVANNGLGIAGLAGGFGSPGLRDMALGVGEAAPIGGVLDDALIYAADNGARVITMSLSVGETSAINDALGYAYNVKDVFIDCASGNNGPSVSYPARRPEVVAVASTDENDNRSGFSNQGPEVEVAAPGSNIRSTQLNNSYGTSSGTSFAAPYVAALAGLVRDLNPVLQAPEVRQLLIDTVEDVEATGFDEETGWGRINAFLALSSSVGADGVVRVEEQVHSCSDVVTIVVADGDLAGSGTVGATVRSGEEPAGETLTLIESDPGLGVFRGSIPTSAGPAAADGLLQLVDADTITAEYVDADDGAGGTNVLKVDTATSDCLAPGISGIAANDIDVASATIAWTTTEPASSQVRYGETPPPPQQAASAVLTTGHAVALNGLQPCTVYHYEVESVDALGNTAVHDNGSAYFTFETLGDFPGVGVTQCHRGQALLDLAIYGCGDTVMPRVVDLDLDADSSLVETVQVLMTSSSEPGGEWIVLTESAPGSAVFEGSIDLAAATVAGDGLLGSAPGDLITVTYGDLDDGNGEPRVAIATALADCTGPAIRDIRVDPITATRATVTWTTDEPATSRVDFGPDASLGSVVETLGLVTSHSVAISAFEACDRVHFRVSAADARGDASSADAGGAPFEINMSEIGGLLFHDNFETDLGWSFTGEWDRGPPQGLGTASADPPDAYSGSSAIGNDLTGEGVSPGDYEATAKEWVFSPPLSTLGRTDLELIFQRKLGVRNGDAAEVAVFAPQQHTIWTSGGAIDDAGWNEQRYDISAVADDLASVHIGFRLESLDAGQTYGWNVDEVIVKDATQLDYATCGGCNGAPTFAGLTAVYDAAPCGASGLTLEWEPAPAWGTATAGTYDIHRATTPDFVPDDANRIASGLSGTSWTDAGAPVDAEVWYVARARNDEICSGGSGLADTNLARLSATETTSVSLPSSPGDTLRAIPVGAAHVRLSWSAAPGADHYVVRSSASPDFSAAAVVATSTETLFEHVGAAADDNFHAYRISAVNVCGDEVE